MHLYFHIPFCQRRCIYCDFYSTTKLDLRNRYVDALHDELNARSGGIVFNTIYIGGGTPSTLLPEQIALLFRDVSWSDDAEITIECNPDDITPEFADKLRRLTPVNRISMGVQSLTDERLRLIGRRHNSAQAIEAVHTLQASGFDNISIDMMYGLPGQSMHEWERDLNIALSLRTQHLSAYSLTYYEDTPLWHLREEHKVCETHEDLSVAMFRHLLDATSDAGFEHYELSNFAKPDRQSRHNTAYWTGKPYIGIGAGAHSYDGNAERRSNPDDVLSYINNDYVPEIEHLSLSDIFNERVFTGLRTARGMETESLQQLSPALYAAILPQIKRHTALGNLAQCGTHIHLTRQALFVSDDVMSDLMVV